MWPHLLGFLFWSGCSTTEKTDSEQTPNDPLRGIVALGVYNSSFG